MTTTADNVKVIRASISRDMGEDLVAWLALADSLEEQGRDQEAEILRLREEIRHDIDSDPEEHAGKVERLTSLIEGNGDVFLVGWWIFLRRSPLWFSLVPSGPMPSGDHKGSRVGPFWMGTFAVTQGQYRDVMGTNPAWFAENGGGADRVSGEDTRDFPVESVSWNDAREFCRRLTGLESEDWRKEWYYDLPTELEWEYACRAGSRTDYHTGRTLTMKQANFSGGEGELNRPCAVGSYPPNAFGLYDMHGNVWEWCRNPLPERKRGEGEDSSDPTESYGVAAGSATAGATGRRSAAGATPGTGTTSSASESSSGEKEGEDSSDPTSGAAAGTTTVGSVGQRIVTGSPPVSGGTTSASESSSGGEGEETTESMMTAGGSWQNGHFSNTSGFFIYESNQPHSLGGFRLIIRKRS